MPLIVLGLSGEPHVYFLVLFISTGIRVFCRLLFPFVQLTRGQSPGRRRRTRHDEAACNIEEREEGVEDGGCGEGGEGGRRG